VGDSVTIFGWDNKAFKSVTEIADLLGTINYEILCAVGNRVERIFV
jgi:alanine racemase